MTFRNFTSVLRSAALAAVLLAAAGAAGAQDQVPVPWNGMDIANASFAGSAKASSAGAFVVTGGSGALAGTHDQFHFVFQSLTGDFTLTARVSASANGGDLAGAGLMVRQALEAGSDFVAVTLTSQATIASIYRTLYAPNTASDAASGTLPAWLKLVKRGTSVQSFVAADRGGAPGAWKRIGSSQPIPSGMVYVGLCHAGTAQGGTAAFDHVSLVTGPQPALDSGVYTITPASAQNMVLVPSGDGVKLAQPTNASSQRWRLTNDGHGFYLVQSLETPSRVLSVPGAKTDNGSPVALAADQAQNTQRWSIVANSSGTFSLLPQFNPGISLDDFQGSGSPAAVIDIWSYNSSDPHLQWMINPAQ